MKITAYTLTFFLSAFHFTTLGFSSQGSETLSDPYEYDQWGLKNSCQVKSLELDFQTNLFLPVPNDRPLNDINFPPPFLGSKKIRVAVLDTGIEKNHPDLAANIVHNKPECEALAKFEKCLMCDHDNTLSCRRNKLRECEKIWMDINNPEVDLDGNGYPLDCNGWSILGSEENQTRTPNPVSQILGRPDFGDNKGHGTHIAGIIGAVSRNGVGIRGCSDNVEILPVQVLTQGSREPIKPLSWNLDPKEPHDPKDRRPMSNLGDFVARGIYYAIHSKTDIINLSLGWPQSVDSDLLRQAIEEAQKRGIIIVAAAGNDSTDALLRPCTYKNVICVGSHNPDGAISYFSNYGPGVDLFAPGLDILSTWPSKIRPQRFRDFVSSQFIEGNYERLHGSSQATAFVSCAVAELLARKIPSSEIYPRLILGSRPPQQPVKVLEANPHEEILSCQPAQIVKPLYDKFGYGGLLDIQSSINTIPRPLILPESKEEIHVNWDRRSAKLRLKVPLKNFWLTSNKEINLKVKHVKDHPQSIRPNIKRVYLEGGSLNWRTSEVKNLIIDLEIEDHKLPEKSRIPSEFQIEITPKIANASISFRIPVVITVPVDPDNLDKDAIKIPIAERPGFPSAWTPLDHILDSRPSHMEYWLTQKTESSWTFHIMSQSRPGEIHDPTLPYFLRASTAPLTPWLIKGRLLEFYTRHDLDGDGKSEYIIFMQDDWSQLPHQRGPNPTRIYIFNHNLEFIREINYDGHKAPMPYNISLHIQWMQFNDAKIPAWVGYGQDPNKKANLRDAWKNRNLSKEYHFWENPEVRFYYLDYEGSLHTVKGYDGYKVADMLAPTQDEIESGTIPVLLIKLRGTQSKPSYLVDFATAKIKNGELFDFVKLEWNPEELSYRNLLDTKVDYSFDLSMSRSLYSGTFWFYPGRPKHMRVTLFDNQNYIYDKQIPPLRGAEDSVLQARYAYSSKDMASTFVLTNSELQYHELNMEQSAYTSLRRYTFIPDLVVENYNFPFFVFDSNKNEAIPTIFTNEGSQFNKGIRFIVPHYEDNKLLELTSPAKLRFQSGKGCEPIDQPFWSGQGSPPFLDFRCRDHIIRYPLSY